MSGRLTFKGVWGIRGAVKSVSDLSSYDNRYYNRSYYLVCLTY